MRQDLTWDAVAHSPHTPAWAARLAFILQEMDPISVGSTLAYLVKVNEAEFVRQALKDLAEGES